MENLALIDSFSEFKDEKLIDRVTLMVILEEVFRNTLKRKFGSDDNFDIIINPDKGDLEIWRNRIVVADGEVEDPNQEIELTFAQKIEPDFEVGEDVSEEVKLIDLGRRSILSLRQNLIAKIYDVPSSSIQTVPFQYLIVFNVESKKNCPSPNGVGLLVILCASTFCTSNPERSNASK